MTLKEEILDELQKIIIDGDYDIVHEVCKKALDAGFSASEILNSGLIKGLNIVGKKYEEKEFFLPDLILSGETMKEGLKFLEPLIETDESSYAPNIIIGTVKDDIHDLGKLILSIVFKAAGFNVIDLGVDVPTPTFIQRAKETNVIIAGKDPVAVETVGATLIGPNPEKMPIIQEAARRGLGEGNIDNIEILGKSIEDLKDRFQEL